VSGLQVHEHADRLFLLGPVQVIKPTEEETKAFAFDTEVTASVELRGFADDLKKKAPNDRILWMRGQYVEADNANTNGDQWTAGELALKALTPNFMPVTVMHDFAANVGVIADTKLLTPEKDKVPRARIETTLAIWAHRFPEVADEARINAEQGTLMQSMECLSPHYACSVCGMNFVRMPHGFEQLNWCAHLKGEEGEKGARILGGVTFTGTGLIFGTRGARGAYSEAHLEVEDLVAFHEASHQHIGASTSMGQIPVEQSDYTALQEKAAKVAGLEVEAAKVPDLVAQVTDLTKKLEDQEAAKVKAEGERDEQKKRADEAEEKANQTTLRDERLGKLGTAFTAKLDKAEIIKTNLQKDAGTLDDTAWATRIEELEAAFGVKADEKKKDGDENEEADEQKAGLFSEEQVASSGLGSGEAPKDQGVTRRSTIGGLARSFGKQPVTNK
jgi:hypothetical protein